MTDRAHRHPLLVLASASPARLATLRAAGLSPAVEVSGIDEEAVAAGLPDPSVQDLVLALAQAKAHAVATTAHGDAMVLGCDSLLEFDGAAFGKPDDTAKARSWWESMRGRSGVLHTGHCLIRCSDGESRSAVTSTITVAFADITDQELEAYLATGEPQRVAGAFTIDGFGGAFVTTLEGDPHNVVGVSLPTLRGLLGELGVTWTDLWSRG